MSRKINDSSSSNNINLDEIRRGVPPSHPPEKLASIEEKSDKTTKEFYLKLDKIEKDTEESRIKTSKNSDETEGLKFQISDQNQQISMQNKTISELESEIEELMNRSLRKTH